MPSESHADTLTESRIRSLREQAARAARNAYAPYSHFKVGAAVLLQDGHVITGCNVENASYRLTVCAEQAAIARAIVERGASSRIVAVAVANADEHIACQPCGACRQTIAEFALPGCRIFYPGDAGNAAECTIADMLPASFSSESLKQTEDAR